MTPLVWIHALAAAPSLDTWSLVTQASGVVKGVMGVLVFMSVVGWYIIGSKYLTLAKAMRETESFNEAFWNSKDIEAIYRQSQGLKSTPLAQMFVAGYTELAKLQRSAGGGGGGDLENVERALMKAQTKETTRLESKISFLATTGSAAPFIGLFGTVWGIMNSFKSIGAMKSASIQTVAPGIAEALIATAIGLVAAIPSVMAYNYFVRRTQVLSADMENFSKDFLNIVRRHFLSK